MAALEQDRTHRNLTWLALRWQSAEPRIYLLCVALATLVAALDFFQSRSTHLSWAESARAALDASTTVRQLPPVTWSAPLDDTFIHFDFARSFARLRWFEWTDGGGYSSGATSWLYPMLLALGIRVGFEGQQLGTFADVLACTSMFGFFWAARSLFWDLPRWCGYLLPLFALSNGVLGWAIWSGMELGLFFGIWALLAHYYASYRNARDDAERAQARLGVGWTGLLLVMTRPEALVCCGLFALFSFWVDASQDLKTLATLSWCLAPAVGFTLIRALLNLLLTGSVADAGALVKLYTLRPFLEPREIALKWLDNVGFQFTRITLYHTSDEAAWGWQIWVLLLLALIPKSTRSRVALLSLQALCWILLVSLNEYVRYQNDRYTMPALLWLLVAVSLGLSGALQLARRTIQQKAWLPSFAWSAAASLLAGSFLFHQYPRWRQQVWLFGRACRNIAEQQIRTGQLLKAGQLGSFRRVLVGDAGAIPYFSELPAADAIGLGGTLGLPFAQAVNLGVGATVELIERLPPDDLPARMALYPSWWDLLPAWFGKRIDEVAIHGNVICGGVSKVLYEAEWRGLQASSRPLELAPGERVVDELDFADIVSEKAHDYQLTSKHSGYVVMKVLPVPRDPSRDLFDAGRLVFHGAKSRFFLRGLRRGEAMSLIFRAAPDRRMAFEVRVDGRGAGSVVFDGASVWQELALALDPRYLREYVSVELVPESSEHILYHLWVVTKEPFGSPSPDLTRRGGAAHLGVRSQR
ncbi:MAG: hypothetical protein ACM3ZE_12280 [Myxococcales bacterium]